MGMVRVAFVVASEAIGGIITALHGAGITDVQVGNGIESGLSAGDVNRAIRTRTADTLPTAQATTATRRDAGQRRPGASRVVYKMGARMTADRIKSLDTLSETQKKVALFIARNAGKVGMSDVQRHFDPKRDGKGEINFHTVDGSINTLRKHEPAIIVSVAK